MRSQDKVKCPALFERDGWTAVDPVIFKTLTAPRSEKTDNFSFTTKYDKNLTKLSSFDISNSSVENLSHLYHIAKRNGLPARFRAVYQRNCVHMKKC